MVFAEKVNAKPGWILGSEMNFLLPYFDVESELQEVFGLSIPTLLRHCFREPASYEILACMHRRMIPIHGLVSSPINHTVCTKLNALAQSHTPGCCCKHFFPGYWGRGGNSTW